MISFSQYTDRLNRRVQFPHNEFNNENNKYDKFISTAVRKQLYIPFETLESKRWKWDWVFNVLKTASISIHFDAKNI